MNFTLTDSKGRLIENFESNKEYTEELQLEKGKEYRLLAQYVDFSGSFSAKCK